jgi:leucyl-tRNA synthetase
LLAPFAPHIAEEIYSIVFGKNDLSKEAWPKYNSKYITEDSVTIVVQVNGKVKAKLSLEKGTKQSDVEKKAKTEIAKLIGNTPIKKTIFVPDRLINFVV